MPLLAYNLTTAPLVLAAGSPAPTLPASGSAGARGPALNVTGELKSLTQPQFTSIQAQVAAGSCEFEWTGLPEYNTFPLIVGSAQDDIAENTVNLYVDSALGNDANPGTLTEPFATFDAGFAKLPLLSKSGAFVNLNLAAGNYRLGAGNGTYVFGKGVGAATGEYNILGTAVDTGLGTLTSLAGSTNESYVGAAVTVDGDQRGAVLRNTVTGQRCLIKNNLNNTPAPGQTTFELLGTGAFLGSVGDTFVVERPGTVFQVDPFETANFMDSNANWQDCKFMSLSEPPFPSALMGLVNTNFTMPWCEFDLGSAGRIILILHRASIWGFTQQYYHTTNPFGATVLCTIESGFFVETVADNIVFVNANVSFMLLNQLDIKNGICGIFNNSWTLLNGGTIDRSLPGSSTIQLSIARGTIGFGDRPLVIKNNLNKDAFTCFDMSTLEVGLVSGDGNAGAGLSAQNMSQILPGGFGPGSTTVTGTTTGTGGGTDAIGGVAPIMTLSDTEVVATGTGDSFVAPGSFGPGTADLIDAAAAFTPYMSGNPSPTKLVITGSTTPANDGTFDIIGWISPTQIVYNNAAAVSEPVAGTWTIEAVKFGRQNGQDVGANIVIAGSTTPANDGTFPILAVVDYKTVEYYNAAGVAELFPGTWSITRDLRIGDITKSYADMPFSESQKFNSGTLALTSLNNGIDGLAGLTNENAGDILQLSGFATPTNNGTFKILYVGSPTQVILAGPVGMITAPDALDGSGRWTVFKTAQPTLNRIQEQFFANS